MSLAATIVIAILGCIQVYILVLEMFLREKLIGLKAFDQTPKAVATTKVLAANQGLSMAFWRRVFWGRASLGSAGRDISVFFLACVLIAGLYGSITVPKTLLIQSLSAVICLVLVFFF